MGKLSNNEFFKERREDVARLLKEFANSCEEHDRTFRTSGGQKYTVRLSDGTYRKKALESMEVFVDGGYVGSRGEPILDFKPVEVIQGVEAIEIPLSDMIDAGELGRQVEDAMRTWAAERHGNAIGTSTLTVMLPNAILRTVIESIDARASKVDEEAIQELSTLPTFGMF